MRGKNVIRKQLDSKDTQLSDLMTTSVISLPQCPYLASHHTAFLHGSCKEQQSGRPLLPIVYWLHTINLYCHLWLHHANPWWQDNPSRYSWVVIHQEDGSNSVPREEKGKLPQHGEQDWMGTLDLKLNRYISVSTLPTDYRDTGSVNEQIFKMEYLQT